ncbi:MAG: hypothetical protein RR101_13280 [Burkholderiaceae bacterium]
MNQTLADFLPARTAENNAERRARTEREVRAAFQSIKDAIVGLGRPISRAELRALLGVKSDCTPREHLARALIETGQAEGLFLDFRGQIDFKEA